MWGPTRAGALGLVPGSAAYNKGSSNVMAAPAAVPEGVKTCIHQSPSRVYNTSESINLSFSKLVSLYIRPPIGVPNGRPRMT